MENVSLKLLIVIKKLNLQLQNLKIYILTRKSEKSVITNDYLSDAAVTFEQVTTSKNYLTKITNLRT